MIMIQNNAYKQLIQTHQYNNDKEQRVQLIKTNPEHTDQHIHNITTDITNNTNNEHHIHNTSKDNSIHYIYRTTHT